MNKNFLHVNDFSKGKLTEILNKSEWIKKKFSEKNDYKPLAGKTMAMIFSKPSARTRISFETGFYRLGGHAIYLGPNDIEIGKRESVSDIAKVLSRFNDIIMARLFKHQHILKLAASSSIPVINGLTDFNHPCQIIADLFTIKEKLGRFNDFTISYVGDGNNIVHSWLELSMVIPFKLNIVCPEEFCPDTKLLQLATSKGVSEICIEHDPYLGVKNSDIIYTDVWASMGQKDQIKSRQRIFKPYQVNKKLIKATNKKTLFMHCLPAERGNEVTDEICDADFSIIFEQAENRMHSQNAIILDLLS